MHVALPTSHSSHPFTLPTPLLFTGLAHLVKVSSRKRIFLTGYYHHGVAPDNSWSKQGDKSQKRVIIGTCYTNHSNGLIDTNCASIQGCFLWGCEECDGEDIRIWTRSIIDSSLEQSLHTYQHKLPSRTAAVWLVLLQSCIPLGHAHSYLKSSVQLPSTSVPSSLQCSRQSGHGCEQLFYPSWDVCVCIYMCSTLNQLKPYKLLLTPVLPCVQPPLPHVYLSCFLQRLVQLLYLMVQTQDGHMEHQVSFELLQCTSWEYDQCYRQVV